MTDLTKLTIAEARDGLKAKDYTSLELTDAFLGAIDKANESLNAYVAVTPDKAREMAKASDEKLAKGEGGALEGIPLGIKDLFATQGIHTPKRVPIFWTASSRPMSPPSRRTCGPTGPSCWASSTWTSSPWARPTRRPITAT